MTTILLNVISADLPFNLRKGRFKTVLFKPDQICERCRQFSNQKLLILTSSSFVHTQLTL